MKIGILGTGAVGKSLAKGFAGIGDDVMVGSRDAQGEKVLAIAKEVGHGCRAGTFADAAKFGEIVVICIPGAATENALKLAGPDNFAGKVVIDVTNPLDFSKGMPPGLLVGHTDSAGEQIQRQLPKAHVVKALNIVGNPDMVNPDFPDGPADMFICGNDAEAKKTVTTILDKFGWTSVLDIGGIEGSRVLEPLTILWVMYGSIKGTWRHAFKVIRK
ncbi:MAG: NAD(P)-binding domain-containing protein [Bacteroidota bacterium]|nr:NAD(P)-binding domain-containing protein [Bacteroidota bacterium]MDP4231641.1 NAD(P)-binding domain-containing protein [Bacteroidota bacterium]